MNELNIIPKPVSGVIEGGSIDLAIVKTIALMHNSDDEKRTAIFLKELLRPVNTLPITKYQKNKMDQIVLSIDPQAGLPPEGYQLIIGGENGAYIKARKAAGLFYGFQTFRQLCPPELEKSVLPKNTRIKNCNIVDHPVFGYRGMHLDVSRHFFDIDFVKTYIDMIALHKMNVFHWHLTDDNGWRIEIKKYPELSKKSAWRVDRTNQPWKEQSPIKPGEKATYGGYYTQDEIRDVIQYASDRNIVVIPEIEMPGHTSEVFAAFPNLSCKGDTLPVNPGSYWPNEDIFCAGNDDVFIFLENVLGEIVELFPGPYVHIGGDEAQKINW
ncbi:MAG: family 20 glycosylhydrolase, partial [Candidatus Neomarinimicrobiota bacterium]|nr:family 20 glycosylhydrolase [Candidatus Neomarinimicrobiota bacterium]